MFIVDRKDCRTVDEQNTMVLHFKKSHPYTIINKYVLHAYIYRELKQEFIDAIQTWTI